ncbi:MAG TPA: DUF1552 domain-containing protein [Verrucomicrobiales bacterium]|nr:DUF1552 domain-containing protein [Verrucomicrobiales bacterium]
MIITKKALNRRTFLRGASAALALPLLDAMVPAMTSLAASPAKPVRRLGYVYIPMGANLAEWTPPVQGELSELTPTLKSLTPHLNQLTVISNLELKNAYSAGNHATSNSAFLSAASAKMTEGSDYELATTADQIAAKRLGAETPLPSLELAMDLMTAVGNCDNGFACVYQNNLSWSSPTTPLPAEAHPRALFERLFGTGAGIEERRADFKKDASILDWVKNDIKRLQKELGPSDRNTIAEYLDTVREVERRIQNAEQRTADAPLPDLDRPSGVPASYIDHAKLMFDLQALALQADLTRVITFQLARETSNRTYPEIGVSDSHHPVSHHSNNPKKLEKLAKINALHVSLFAYYLDKLKSTPDGDGTLLDHSLILCGSGMGNPNVHDHVDLPILLAGGGTGTHKGGRHIRYSKPTPLANLHLSMLEKVGVQRDTFADSSGKLEEIYAPLSL